MALTNCYITLASLSAELQIPDRLDDARLEQAISAASRQIDAHCGRAFWAEASAAARQFQATSSTMVEVVDISTRTDLVVAIDEQDDGTFSTTLTETTDFLLYPLNADLETPARPWNEIRAIDNYNFPTGRRPGVQVTAKFGYPAIPDAVASACMIQAKNIYKVTGAGVFGSMQISVDGIAMRIPALDYVAVGMLEPFRRVVV